ncbi:upstream stimulatory factor 2 isoform X1 [Schistocerca americana]|uniref:upstream stimulatory factor 2 isoform X1 n=1 Tax=Schistocerca americana TaxID=7009 RepID=UPI001F4FBDCF|nr:upstream stimulatory factor 2 isoform X1 [Schistocerca americana]XP_047099783.1 upstream stimulatory factor 2 isoform X2 [Schistocerca piceifrons]XP_049768683.1 upstream stimulatory factor 2 isoform X2 [Schistocerca cancellata]XP_049795394.1 upstream stimulatory factor 2 isoform X1 [Schistocerca nitens]XP_049841330.1 upstream stimulatory factor 2 isoform X1 [Schistocerca gregaria]XP_049943814.1 upstream stimulatory factor 2 isoform X1 [Schistocerca serialis cubense]
MADTMESERFPLIFLTSQEKDGDGSEDCVTDSKDIIAAQSLTIVEEDGSLGSVEDQSAVAELAQTQGLLEAGDEEVQYQFRAADSGTVTYRVVQVTGGDSPEHQMPQVVATAGDGTTFATAGPATPGIQAVLTNPLNGQVYVIGSTPEVFTTQTARPVATRTSESSLGRGIVPTRDDRRRATHNEVERRRRDKINNWIGKLSKIIPNCSPESTKTGQSKGGILAKACEYINELREANIHMTDTARHREKELEQLRRQNEELKRENAALRARLAQVGEGAAAT